MEKIGLKGTIRSFRPSTPANVLVWMVATLLVAKLGAAILAVILGRQQMLGAGEGMLFLIGQGVLMVLMYVLITKERITVFGAVITALFASFLAYDIFVIGRWTSPSPIDLIGPDSVGPAIRALVFLLCITVLMRYNVLKRTAKDQAACQPAQDQHRG